MRGTLVAAATPWVGRVDALARLSALLRAGPGLITLLGPGGAGKTRLAVEVARSVGIDAVGVALAAARDGDDLEVAVAEVVGKPVPTALAALGPAVLVLDNLEQLGTDAALRIGEWLRAAPELRILATSRTRLGLQAEHTFPVEPLDQADAVALFVDRVARRRGHYAPTGDQHERVVALVSALDRLPLALELAAGRAADLGVARVLRQLGRRPTDLGDGAIDRDPRHATLHATVAWSWDLLDAAERAHLAGAALLPGPFDPTDIAWLGDDADLVVARLTDASLLRPERRPDGTISWHHYVAVRAFALEHVPDGFLGRCVDHLLRLGDPDPRREALLDLAARCEEAGDLERVASLGLALDPVLFRSGPGARRLALLRRVATGLPEDDPRRGEALVSLAMTTLEPTLAPQLASAVGAARRAGNAPLEARLHLAQGQNAFDAQDLPAAAAHARRAQQVAEVCGEARCALGALWLQANVHTAEADMVSARAAYEAALGISRREGRSDEWLILGQLGSVALDCSDPDAGELLEAAVQGLAAHDDHRRSASMARLAELAVEQGRPDDAAAWARDALRVIERAGQLRFEGFLLGHVGLAQEARGDLQEARATLARAEVANEGRGHPVLGGIIASWRGRIDAELGLHATARQHLDRARAVLRDNDKLRWLPELCAAHLDPSTALSVLEASMAAPPASEVRLARQRLQAAIGVPAHAVRIAADGAWFETPGHPRADLSTRHAIRRVLLRLVDARRDEPGVELNVDALFDAGWPGQAAVQRAARDRVYHAVATLRRMGLEELLRRGEHGWYLVPEALVTVE